MGISTLKICYFDFERIFIIYFFKMNTSGNKCCAKYVSQLVELMWFFVKN